MGRYIQDDLTGYNPQLCFRQAPLALSFVAFPRAFPRAGNSVPLSRLILIDPMNDLHCPIDVNKRVVGIVATCELMSSSLVAEKKGIVS